MKPNVKLLLSCVVASALAFSFAPQVHAGAGTGPSFKGPIGLQLYSLRAQFAKDVPHTMDEVEGWGIKDVELAGTYNLTPEQFKAQLDAHHLDPISAHFGYERYRDDIEGVARDLLGDPLVQKAFLGI